MSAAARRGRALTADVAALILRDVAAGATIPAASRTHGFTDRTVERYANRHPDYAGELEHAKRAGAAIRRQRRPPRAEIKRHGTTTGWQRGCRCVACRAANSAAVARWRASRRAQGAGTRRAM